jgi:hypothetical protein
MGQKVRVAGRKERELILNEIGQTMSHLGGIPKMG